MSEQTTTHTPGPWIVGQGHGDIPHGTLLVRSEEYGGIAIVPTPASGSLCETQQWGEAEANAQLIAAAPDLLEVCKAYMTWRTDKQPHSNIRLEEVGRAVEYAIREAIAKAEGTGL